MKCQKCQWMQLTCKDVEQDAMQHQLPDWYFPSFTLTQKTSAWPSDCIHVDVFMLLQWCQRFQNEQINYFNEHFCCERSECETGCVSDTCEYSRYIHICIYVNLWIRDAVNLQCHHCRFILYLLAIGFAKVTVAISRRSRCQVAP